MLFPSTVPLSIRERSRCGLVPIQGVVRPRGRSDATGGQATQERRIEMFVDRRVRSIPWGSAHTYQSDCSIRSARKELHALIDGAKGMRFWKTEGGLLKPQRAAFKLIIRTRW